MSTDEKSNELQQGQLHHALTQMRDDDKYFTYGAIVWDALTPGMREQLKQLFYQGPVADGCVVSKCDRDKLINYGLATRCCFMAEQGYTAATYLGGSVVKQGKAKPYQLKSGTR